MSLHHASSGEVIDLRALGAELDGPSTALVRTDDLEVMRLVLPSGRSVPQHRVSGEITLQCLEGAVEVQAGDDALVLDAGKLVYLASNIPYALRALQDSSLLMTLLRKEGEHDG